MMEWIKASFYAFFQIIVLICASNEGNGALLHAVLMLIVIHQLLVIKSIMKRGEEAK